MHISRKELGVALFTAFALANAGSVTADTHWQAGTGSWFTAGNWDNGLPQPDAAGFAVPPPGYNIPGTLWVGYTNFGNSAFIDNGGTAQITSGGAGTRELVVGDAGTGFLEITGNGSLTSHRTYIGRQAGSVGEILVSGPNALWTYSNAPRGCLQSGSFCLSPVRPETTHVYVGYAGQGKLTVANGASARVGYFPTISTGISRFVDINVGSQPGGYGEILVTGAGSLLEGNGYMTVSRGKLRIESGGLATVTNQVAIGSSGNLEVSGASSRLQTGLLLSYNGAQGRIDQGGLVTLWNDAALSGGDFVVDGAGSLLQTDRYLIVGSGSGSMADLQITNGGRVRASSGTSYIVRNTYAGRTAGSTGSIVIDGAGSELIADFVYAGDAGSGRVDVQNGGLLSSRSVLVGNAVGGQGRVQVDGTGSQLLTGGLTIGNVGSGQVDVINGGYLTSVGTTVGDNGALNVSGSSSRVVMADNPGIGVISLYHHFRVFGDVHLSDGAVLTTPEMGIADNGTLLVDSGAQLYASMGAWGNFSVGDITVTGAGSLVSYDTPLLLGSGSFTGFFPPEYGDSSLSLFDGGQLSASSLHLGPGYMVFPPVLNAPSPIASTNVLNIGNGGVAGVLDVASIFVDPQGEGIINFNHADAAYQFANAGGSPIIVNGFAQLNQIGTGTTYLDGVQNYTGNTTITDGRLIVNGSATASSFYLNGGVLGGNGNIGPVYLNGGVLAPGNSIGTLNVAAIDFSGGGVYEVEVDAAGNSDRINVSGTAALGGGRVSVLPMAGNYANETIYTILSAATLDGTFDSVSVDLPAFAYLDAALDYTANDVLLTLSRNDTAFGLIAANVNQWAVGTGLAQLFGDPGISDITDALTVLDVAGAQSALQSLSGDIHAYGQMLSLEANRQFGAGALDVARLRTQRGLWLQGFGSDGEFDRDQGVVDTDTRHRGAALGYDTAMGNAVWGVAVGYSQSMADAGSNDMDVDSIHAGMYVQWQQGYHYLKGSAVAGQHDIETSRQIAVGSLLAQANSDSDAVSAGLDIEGGHTFPWQGSTASITPFVGLGYGWVQRDAFVEEGAGQASLSVHEDNYESLRSRLGARFQYAWALANVIRIEPAVELAWAHEYLKDAVAFRAGFAGAPAVGFEVSGPELDRDRAQVGVGVNVMFSGTSQLEFNYRGDLAGSDEQHAAYLTYRMAW